MEKYRRAYYRLNCCWRFREGRNTRTNLRRLRHLAYVGAPCPPQLPEGLASKTRLHTLYGSSETGTLATDLKNPEDGEYIRFNATIAKELRPVCRHLYELVSVRHATSGSFQGIFLTYPDLKEYRMGDLFSKHPTKDDVWLFRGRVYSAKADLEALSGGY